MDDKNTRKQLIDIGIGLQKVDGLKVSSFYRKQSQRYIDGEISLDELEEIVASHYQKMPRGRRQNIIKLMEERPNITTEEIAKQLDVSLRTVKYDIAVLKEKGIIKRVGGKNHGHWEVKK